MEFNNKTHCSNCKRFIDDVDVRWKKIVTDDAGKWEVYCTDCASGKKVQEPNTEDKEPC